MNKEREATAGSAASGWLSELVHVGMYKRSQGKIARQATFGAMVVSIGMAAYRLMAYMSMGTMLSYWPLTYLPEGTQQSLINGAKFWLPEYTLPMVLFAVGLWVSYRVVNIPQFADFLIAVEAEMNKVSWPSKDELIRSSIVVIFVIITMSGLLYGYDALWAFLFSDSVLGILHTTK